MPAGMLRCCVGGRRGKGAPNTPSRAAASSAIGTGGTSGIVAAEDPFATLDEMFEALDRARTDFCKED